MRDADEVFENLSILAGIAINEDGYCEVFGAAWCMKDERGQCQLGKLFPVAPQLWLRLCETHR